MPVSLVLGCFRLARYTHTGEHALCLPTAGWPGESQILPGSFLCDHSSLWQLRLGEITLTPSTPLISSRENCYQKVQLQACLQTHKRVLATGSLCGTLPSRYNCWICITNVLLGTHLKSGCYEHGYMLSFGGVLIMLTAQGSITCCSCSQTVTVLFAVISKTIILLMPAERGINN